MIAGPSGPRAARQGRACKPDFTLARRARRRMPQKVSDHMANEKNSAPRETAKPEAKGDDWGEEATFIHAHTMEDGEVIIGRYLGYDLLDTQFGLRPRHCFEIDADGTITAVWGASMLNAMLKNVQLGVETRVERLGEEHDLFKAGHKLGVKDSDRVVFSVRQRGTRSDRGVIGRQDPASGEDDDRDRGRDRRDRSRDRGFRRDRR